MNEWLIFLHGGAGQCQSNNPQTTSVEPQNIPCGSFCQLYRQCQFLLTIVRFQLGLMVFHVRVGGAVKDTLEGAMGLLLTPMVLATFPVLWPASKRHNTLTLSVTLSLSMLERSEIFKNLISKFYCISSGKYKSENWREN